MNTEERTITIVDDIMGSGKSTWAINYINDNPDRKFLCIVPLLSECERFKDGTDIDIVDPEKWGSKWKHFRWLVENEKNIVTTHSLIQKMDLDMLELLKSKDYVLMIDECLDVLDTYKITKDDMKIIFEQKLVSLDDKGFLIWNDDKKYKGVFGDIKRLCSFKSLMGFKKEDSEELARIIMWNFPVDFFKCFEESYIFTYLWEGSIQKSYFDIHGIHYEKYMLDYDRKLIKKSYYDYDKTLKNKTKDIEVLERQIAALEGSTSAEDKARKAKLQEQLDSAKEDLNDTITDHAYSMQTDALDKLSADMSEDLDKWINTISSNMEEMTTAINDAVKNAGLSTAGTINAISSILRHYRLSDSEISQSGLTNITGYASGTNYVNKSGIYRVNEKGMESVFSKQYGTLTFLNQGDKVFDANFTKQLLDNSTIATQKNMPDYAGMAKAIEKNIQNIQNLSGNTYVNNFYIDGAQDTESILREIDKHLDKKIQAHDKKQVRDFKSLR